MNQGGLARAASCDRAGSRHPIPDDVQHDPDHEDDDEILLVRFVVLGEEPIEGVNAAEEANDGVLDARRLKRVDEDLDRHIKQRQSTNSNQNSSKHVG